MKKFISLFIYFAFSILHCQEAVLTGLILDDQNLPIKDVNIQFNDKGSTSDINGYYKIAVESNKTIDVIFSHINHKQLKISLELSENEVLEFNPILNTKFEQISEVILNSTTRSELKSILNISPEKLRNIKGIQPGIENIMKTLPGVSINNEMSTQYSVRGGNFDENLVYVNGIEIYRPFLIRSGQQEGLSFINSEMIDDIKFSSGGFEAIYGDKMSSILDIKYKSPTSNQYRFNSSLLGGSLTSENISKNNKISNILGVRYRDNSLLVNSKETKSNFKPSFFDLQNFLKININSKIDVSSIINFSVNNYNFKPINRQTNFGTLDDPLALIIFYNGEEKDKYSTFFNSFSVNFKPNQLDTYSLISSFYNTNEKEYFDILAQYRLGEVNTNIGDDDLGEVEFSEGIGSQLNHARNDLDALITNIEHKGNYNIEGNNFEWSLKYTREDIRDRLVEWEVIDSAGFFINPPNIDAFNQQPYEAYQGPLVPFQNVRATNEVIINRVQAYAQWSKRSTLGNNDVWYNGGVRVHNWNVDSKVPNQDGVSTSSQTVFSPRAQFAIKPDWEKDMLFRVSGGLYYQPPFYRELRDSLGVVHPDVKAQKSFHFVIGNEYSFKMWDRPFKLVSEAYYKGMTDVNPYTLENVRIRYRARNNAIAYAYGLDLRLNGEFVPGTESWFSFGYLKTEENIDDRGFIARPTDQRLKFAALFQDYVPNIPSMKMYLNLVFNTGVPGGSPSYADPYVFQNRLSSYKRADIGFQYVLVDETKQFDRGWKKAFKELSFGVEIFNMFNTQNSITNTWVRDVYSKRQFAIPNFLTPRVFNVRLQMKF